MTAPACIPCNESTELQIIAWQQEIIWTLPIIAKKTNMDKENPSCPLVNAALRFPEVDYGKYKNIILHIRGNSDEST